ncbi:MAG: type IV pilus biogenesis/stability protein PilW [Xanthomonadales bacterium]|nr:type IV pilus biogenesis/stability protein PilW [Xanthomonadales bacterium]
MNRYTPGVFHIPNVIYKTPLRLWSLVLMIALISGCASNQEKDPYDETKTQKAVESNTALGLEYMNRGQYEVALGKLKKAVREDPKYAPAQTVLAVLYERIGEQELAGKHYEKAYEADPDNGDVNNNYGVYLCQNGEERQAIEHFLRALDDPFYSSPSIALTNAGSCALGHGDMVDADDYLRRALKIEPDFPDALLNMSRLSFEQEKYLTARAFMQRYEEVTSHTAETLLLAYRVEAASGNRKSATTYKLMLETNFPESDQTAEVRRLSGR